MGISWRQILPETEKTGIPMQQLSNWLSLIKLGIQQVIDNGRFKDLEISGVYSNIRHKKREQTYVMCIHVVVERINGEVADHLNTKHTDILVQHDLLGLIESLHKKLFTML